MLAKAAALFFLSLALTGCIADRYAWNIQHTYVTAWTHLSDADREHVVHVVSRATRQPIQGIVRWKPDSKQVSVFTGFSDASPGVHPWTGFQFEKRSDGWHMVGQDIISPGMATILLTNPPNDTHRPKKT